MSISTNLTKDFLTDTDIMWGISRPGFLHTKYYEEMPTFERAQCEIVYPDANYISTSTDESGQVVRDGGDQRLNCQIVFGRDRPSHLLSGYGKMGGTPCASIDIVAGRMSSANKPTKGLFKKDLEPPKRDVLVGNNFFSDASRIYISQKCNIDHYFGIPPGRSGRPKGEAAIGMKSDHVRVIGRDSVKIYAGGARAENLGVSGELNSNGEFLTEPVIEFVTNLDTDPEPLVKGNKLIMLLDQMMTKMKKMSETMVRQNGEIIKISSALAKHFHIGGGIGYITVGPDPILATEAIAIMAEEVTEISNEITKAMNTEVDRTNYLGLGEKRGLFGIRRVERLDESQIKLDTYILSKNVFTT